jgi:hypothetical protein
MLAHGLGVLEPQECITCAITSGNIDTVAVAFESPSTIAYHNLPIVKRAMAIIASKTGGGWRKSTALKAAAVTVAAAVICVGVAKWHQCLKKINSFGILKTIQTAIANISRCILE